MAQSKLEFFRNGVNDQKRPDIVIDLRRVSIKEMGKWTPEQKKEAIDVINRAENIFKTFARIIKNA